MSDAIHTYPTDDLIQHEVDGEDCPCGPTTVPVVWEDGSMRWHVIHDSLDGRELAETGRTIPEEQP